MKTLIAGIAAHIIVVSIASAGDTNFVDAFDATWQAGNASNILVFVESAATTNRNVETLYARAVVAGILQEWCRGASNFLEQAISEATNNPSYSEAGRSNVVISITGLKEQMTAIAEGTSEPTNSQPSWNTNAIAAVLSELGGEPPFLSILRDIAQTH